MQEIKARQLFHQHLTAPVDMLSAARDLCGVQAQFLSNAMHALRIRSVDFSEAAARQKLVKSWTLRGTMHVFAPADLPLFLHEGRAHFLRPCDTLEADEHVTRERKQFFADCIVKAVAEGVEEREALKAVCHEAGMTDAEAESIFNAWGGTIRALCEAGTLCHSVQERKAFGLCPPFEPMGERQAQLELARRYFTHYAPATIKDAAYFFGTTQTQVKRWLDELPVTSRTCEGRTYYAIGEAADVPDIPECIFLAGFDPLMLGYQKTESLYLPQEHLRGIFNLAGIVMPAVLWRGRAIGKWKRTGKKLLLTLFEPLPERERTRLKDHALAQWPDVTKIEC